MATMITSECINCGACEPECPNNAISQSQEIYVIDPLLCTECVGFHDYEACAAVCPVDCCVTDPNNVESEEVLIARARELHKEVAFAENFESRFRKEAGAPAAVSAERPSAPTPPPNTHENIQP
jgi:ferredoxin